MGKRSVQLLAVLATLAVVGSTSGQFHEFTHNGLQAQRLVMSGDPAPGMPAGVTVYAAGPTSFGAYGGIAFNAGLLGPGIERDVNNVALYTLRDGQLVPVAQGGAPAPGLDPPATFSGTTLFQTGPVNAAGDVAFDATATGQGTGTWLARPQPELLAINGMPAPGTGGLEFKYPALNPALSQSGHVAFRGKVGVPGDDQNTSYGIWSDRGGTMTRIYNAGDSSPVPGATLNRPFPKAMAPDDRLALGDRLIGAGITTANDAVIMRESGGGLQLVAREGDPAPGTGGALFKDFFGDGFTVASAEGRIATYNSLKGTNVTTGNDTGIWSEAAGPLRLVAREGDIAPGVGDGVRFDGFPTPDLNSTGQTLFKARLTDPGTPGYSLWLDDAGSLELLAKYGQFAPGFGPNAYFTGFNGAMGINNAGDIIFEATTYDPASLYSTDAVYRMDGGLPKLVISEWQMFDGQMVGGIDFLGLNELRQLGLWVTFVGPDGAAFTSDDVHGYYLVTIPEPATLALLALGGLAIVRRWRA